MKTRMEQAGKIKVYKDVLATIQEEEPEAAPRRQPQLPVTRRVVK